MDTKYFDDVKSAAPSKTDARDHNGKYFKKIFEDKPTGEMSNCTSKPVTVKKSEGFVAFTIDPSKFR